MIIPVDSFLDRRPGPRYNCFDFVREVSQGYRNDIAEAFTFLGLDFKSRNLGVAHMRAFTKIEKPVDGCFVVLQRRTFVPHIGIWWKGKVLHLGATGAMYEFLSHVARRYPKVSYFV